MTTVKYSNTNSANHLLDQLMTTVKFSNTKNAGHLFDAVLLTHSASSHRNEHNHHCLIWKWWLNFLCLLLKLRNLSSSNEWGNSTWLTTDIVVIATLTQFFLNWIKTYCLFLVLHLTKDTHGDFFFFFNTATFWNVQCDGDSSKNHSSEKKKEKRQFYKQLCV